MKINKREREVLRYAVVFNWEIVVSGRGSAHWDGDALSPFRAWQTLDQLINKGLMTRSTFMRGEWYRATALARDYTCRNCYRGRAYEEDQEIGKCETCDGTGLLLNCRTSS